MPRGARARRARLALLGWALGPHAAAALEVAVRGAEEAAATTATPTGAAQSGAVCFDQVYWRDTSGWDCGKYVVSRACTPDGDYGPGWPVGMGTFEQYEKDGYTALTACCACGGGLRRPTKPRNQDLVTCDYLEEDGHFASKRFPVGVSGDAACKGVGECQFTTLEEARKFCTLQESCRGVLRHPLEDMCGGKLGCYTPRAGKVARNSEWAQQGGKTWLKTDCTTLHKYRIEPEDDDVSAARPPASGMPLAVEPEAEEQFRQTVNKTQYITSQDLEIDEREFESENFASKLVGCFLGSSGAQVTTWITTWKMPRKDLLPFLVFGPLSVLTVFSIFPFGPEIRLWLARRFCNCRPRSSLSQPRFQLPQPGE